MEEISVNQLKEMMDKKEDFVLIDVRETWEHTLANIGGKNIPLATVPEHTDEIPTDKKVVVYCRSGKRSANSIAYLQENFGYTNLINLEGGILAWSDQIDPEVPKY